MARRTLRVGAGGGSRLTMAIFWVTRRSPVTHLRKLMLEELQRRNYSDYRKGVPAGSQAVRRVLPPTAGSTGPRSHPAISVLSSAGEKAQPPFRRATGVGATILLREDVEAALHAGAHPVSQSSAHMSSSPCRTISPGWLYRTRRSFTISCSVPAPRLCWRSLPTPNISERKSAFRVCSTPGARICYIIRTFIV